MQSEIILFSKNYVRCFGNSPKTFDNSLEFSAVVWRPAISKAFPAQLAFVVFRVDVMKSYASIYSHPHVYISLQRSASAWGYAHVYGVDIVYGSAATVDKEELQYYNHFHIVHISSIIILPAERKCTEPVVCGAYAKYTHQIHFLGTPNASSRTACCCQCFSRSGG